MIAYLPHSFHSPLSREVEELSSSRGGGTSYPLRKALIMLFRGEMSEDIVRPSGDRGQSLPCFARDKPTNKPQTKQPQVALHAEGVLTAQAVPFSPQVKQPQVAPHAVRRTRNEVAFRDSSLRSERRVKVSLRAQRSNLIDCHALRLAMTDCTAPLVILSNAKNLASLFEGGGGDSRRKE